MDEYFKTASAYAVVGVAGFFVGATAMARHDKRMVEKNNTRVSVVAEFLNWLADAMDTVTPDEFELMLDEKMKFLNIALEET